MMNDLLYFFAAPGALGMFYLLYRWTEREWVDLTTEEINAIWDLNLSKYGTVEDYARALEYVIRKKNP